MDRTPERKKKWRVCIVGCGGIAAVHASVLRGMEEVELCGFADCRKERAERFCREFGGDEAGVYEDLESMAEKEKPDVVHICTPHYLHVPMAQLLLEQGISVFMEKPPAISQMQYDILEKAAAKSRGCLGICFQNRYNKTTRKIDMLLKTGEMGEVLGARAFVTWNRTKAYYTESGWRGRMATEGGGALINQSIHTLDLMIRWLGRPIQVEASMRNHHLRGITEVEDTVEGFLTFDRGVRACFYATTAYVADAPIFLELACTNGTVRLEETCVWVRYQDGRETYDRFGKKEGSPGIGKSYWGDGHGACVADFYRCLEQGETYPNDLASVKNTFDTMRRLYEEAGIWQKK